MFNVSDSNAAKYQQFLLRLMGKFERGMQTRFFPILQQAYDEAGNLLEHGQTDFSTMIEKHRVSVLDRLQKEYNNLLAYFGTFTFDQFKKEYQKSLVAPKIKGMEEIYWQDVKEWAKVSALSRARNISKTTNSLIQILIRNGMREGLSNNDIVKKLKEERKTFNKVRAIRIVRTETHAAANKAINSAVKSTGYKHERVWLATLDDRVRGADPKDKANHLRANGQKRDMDVPFDIPYGGMTDKLEYPGDPKARPAQTANCRCVLKYMTKKV